MATEIIRCQAEDAIIIETDVATRKVGLSAIREINFEEEAKGDQPGYYVRIKVGAFSSDIHVPCSGHEDGKRILKELRTAWYSYLKAEQPAKESA